MKTFMYPTFALLLLLGGCGVDSITGSSPTDGNGSGSTQDSPQTTRADYFPLEVGTTWTYGESARVVRVTDKVETLFGSGYMLEGLLQNRIVRKNADGKALESLGREWRLLFDLDAGEQASWTIEAPDGGDDLLDGTKVTVVSKSEAVGVPYGRFEASVHLAMRPRTGLADAGITDMWFVRDVGLVKWSEIWIGGVRDFELTAFETVKTPPSRP